MNLLNEILHFFFSPPYYLNIDPVMLKIFSFEIRWYSMPYLLGILFAYIHFKRLKTIKAQTAEDAPVYALIGIVIGARIGIATLYYPEFYFTHPLEIFKLWHGGMSAHGAFLGGIVACYALAKRHDESFWLLFDEQIYATAFFLTLGRIANFINGELYGVPTYSDWGVIFPMSRDYLPRHPSQLYEAFAEGLLPFLVLISARKFAKIHNYRGMASGIFFFMYSIGRYICEFYRVPEKLYFHGTMSMGQILSIPMLPMGIYAIYRSIKVSQEEK